MLWDKCDRQRVKLRLTVTIKNRFLAAEPADIQERHDQKVKGIKTPSLDRKTAIAIGGITTLDLNAYLSGRSARLGAYTNQVLALVVRWRLVRKDAPAHQVPDDEVLGA
jgi:hypothetical protein